MEERYCPGCEQTKNVDEFHKSEARGYQVYCKICRKTVDAAAYQKNKDKRILQNAKWREEFKAWYHSLKTGPCTDCGNTYHPACMQWDHLPEFKKTGNISEMYTKAQKQLLTEEIKKCELVCANCHALRTYFRQ